MTYPRCDPHLLNVTRSHAGTPGASGEDGYSQFIISTTQTTPCGIAGYPLVTLYGHNGRKIPFALQRGGGMFVTGHPPGVVRLEKGTQAFAIAAKYRCDTGYTVVAETMRFQLPGFSSTWIFAIPAGHSYCTGGSTPDPGNTVSVSPVEATLGATLPLP